MADILADVTPPQLRQKFLKDLKSSKDHVDTDQNAKYSEISESTEDFELEEQKQDVKLNEYIFLIDRSGSMSGPQIKLAVKALKLFLHSLPIGCKFNVYSFGSEYEKIYQNSVDYNQESLDRAIAIITSYDADLGGTEILDPLEDIFEEQPDPKFPRLIFLLTDGAVQNTAEVVQLIKQNSDQCKVHTFGIGHGASTDLVKNCAIQSGGNFYFIHNL